MTQRDLGLTFAGGGNRAFYQLGVMNRWRERVLPRVAAMAACSAGAFVAVVLLSGRQEQTQVRWHELRRGLRRNFDARRLLRGENPAPHGPIYRALVIHAMRDGGLERLREQPFPVLALSTRIPARAPLPLALLTALGIYRLERKLHPERLHRRWPPRVGFRPIVHDLRQCESPEQVAERVLASSATPPFTPLGHADGERLVDGGLIDNAPAFVAEGAPGVRRNLVLLTRPLLTRPGLTAPRGKARLYVSPRRPIEVSAWDYTEGDHVEAVIAQGEAESESYAAELSAWLRDA
ncbi:MAG: patatin-like phospholipase family protein [Polyangiaceae bacterium]